MQLKITKPIVFFDLETTGVDLANDRIVSIGTVKWMPDGTTEESNTLVNPEVSIPKEATEVHKITNEMVKDAPAFKEIAKGLYAFFNDCDIAGFNCTNFDIPILSEAFLRCDINFPQKEARFIDVSNIYRKKEARTLSAGYKFYCGKELSGAHDALADTKATYEVFIAQLNKYPELRDVDAAAEYCKVDNRADLAGKIVMNENGEYIYNFGKSKGKSIKDEPSFAEWMLKQQFITQNTKMVVRRIFAELGIPEPLF